VQWRRGMNKAISPFLNFGLSENCRRKDFAAKFSSRNAKFEAENPYFWERKKLRQNENFEHP